MTPDSGLIAPEPANEARLLPDDPILPGLAAIRALGLARVIPNLQLGDGPIELISRSHYPGSRITLEARAGERRFAIKAYASDATREAALYRALADAGLGGATGNRAPPLLAWRPELMTLVIGWLDGPSAEQLVRSGKGARAGELTATWLRRAAKLGIDLGRHYDSAAILLPMRRWVEDLVAADLPLGQAARKLAHKLERTQPHSTPAHFVHGTFYTRHVIDLGDGAGVIDWQRFGRGPLELDAGIFLATVWRVRQRPEHPVVETARAEASFMQEMAGLLDGQALAWYRAAMLLRLASKLTRRRHEPDWSARAVALLGEASRA